MLFCYVRCVLREETVIRYQKMTIGIHRKIYELQSRHEQIFFVSPLKPRRPTGDVDAGVLIYTATALGRGREGQSYTRPLLPLGKAPGSHFKEAEWTPEPVWTRRREEKLPPPITGIEPGTSSPQPSALLLQLPDHHEQERDLRKIEYLMLFQVYFTYMYLKA